jgi:hypothetical protein
MKNIILLLMLSVFCYACGCGNPETVDFNNIVDKEWLIYKSNQVFNYKNPKGQKNTYFVLVDNQVRNVKDRFTIPMYAGCDGNWNISSQIIFLIKTDNTDTIKIRFDKTITKDTYGSIQHTNRKEYQIPSLQNIDNLMMTNFDSLSISGSYAQLLKKITLQNQKTYDNVLQLSNVFKNVIYYHKTTGIIRFETANGDIWELE